MQSYTGQVWTSDCKVDLVFPGSELWHVHIINSISTKLFCHVPQHAGSGGVV